MPQTVGIPLVRPAQKRQQAELPRQLLQAVGCLRRIPEIEQERRSMNPIRANSARTRMAPASEDRFSLLDPLTLTDWLQGQGNKMQGR